MGEQGFAKECSSNFEPHMIRMMHKAIDKLANERSSDMKALFQDEAIAKLYTNSAFGGKCVANTTTQLAATGIAPPATVQWSISTADNQGVSEVFADQAAGSSRTPAAPTAPRSARSVPTVTPPGTDEHGAVANELTPARPLRAISKKVTALVVRNIPARYNQERMLQEWVPDGTFNLLYVPYNIEEGRSKGYAYLNFTTHQNALAFQLRWHGRRFEKMDRCKHLDVATATRQGVRANLELLRGRDIAKLGRRGCLPVVFDGRRPVDPMPWLRNLGMASE